MVSGLLIFFIASFCFSVEIVEISEIGKVYFSTVLPQEYKYFNVSMEMLFNENEDEDNKVNIFVIPFVGALGMFSAILDFPEAFPKYTYCKSSEGRCLDVENYIFNVATFKKSDPYFQKHTGNELRISVEYMMSSKSFTYQQIPFYIYITKTNVDLNKIMPNFPIINRIFQKEDFQYSNFFLSENVDIITSVTPITSGDVDQLLSSFTNEPNFKTPFNERYMGVSAGFDAIIAQTDDEKYKSNCSWGIGCVSLVPQYDNTFYSIYWKAKSTEEDSSSYTLLYEGFMLGGEVRLGEYDYYKFFLPSNEKQQPQKLVISVSSITDKKNMYTDIYMLSPSSVAGNPNSTNCDFCNSHSFESSNSIVVKNPSEAGYYRIAVYGSQERTTKYLITVFQEGAVSLTTDNTPPLNLNIESKGGFLPFRYNAIKQNSTKSFSVMVSCDNNEDLEMYVSFHSDVLSSQSPDYPGPLSHDFKGYKNGNDLIYFNVIDFVQGSYFFSMYNTGDQDQVISVVSKTLK